MGEERAKQLKNSLITRAFELGMGDIKRTGALIRDAFADATFQFFLAECLTPEQAVDKVCLDNICGFLDSLGREEGGQGRLQNEPEQLRRLFVMAITGKRRLASARKAAFAPRRPWLEAAASRPTPPTSRNSKTRCCTSPGSRNSVPSADMLLSVA